MSRPDLFVVCKNCGAEISPYVTECPYCGRRVRKRAPRVEIGGEERRRGRSKAARRPRLRRLAGPARWSRQGRPLATLAVVIVSAAVTLAAEAGVPIEDLGALVPGFVEQPWRLVTAAFLHTSVGYLAVAVGIGGLALYGLERRFGTVVAALVYLACAAAASAVALALAEVVPGGSAAGVVAGANGAALGVTLCFVVERRLAGRGALEEEIDPLALLVAIAVLALLPLAVPEASVGATIGGAVAGCLSGLVLAAWRRRGERIPGPSL
ncbi:rhomboid family intramembrane serine protease [Thermoleophilum album]|uniref:Membrane associated serine protease, rhomboid family n=1 Tax=Thermoleophilum album TaxID=29539 RepID=A0A1H6FI31_THEAL|nr:rhomboid family intramembrane serine protease [Thermoleophilum album]SEH10496.1 Membrane associated serine protease, rhomboid family [Thermoleophilum album]